MTRNNEKLLIAVLAGVIIAGAATFAIQPSLASHAGAKSPSQLSGPSYDVLTLRLSDKA